jgi:hypothetical protein
VRNVPLPRGNKSILNKKVDHSISGKNKEDIIHTALREYGFNVHREVEYSSAKFDQKYHKRKIDIKFSYGKMDRYMESDGKVHGNLETPTLSTMKRNSDFEKAKIPYMLINHESIKDLRKIMGLKNITIDELTKFLVVYRAWEEYSKHLAKIEAGELFV